MTDPQSPIPTAGSPKSPIQNLPPMGLGTWSWGDKIVWSYGCDHAEADARAAFRAAVAAGITLFDTAEFYGFGESERLLRRFIAELDPAAGPPPLVVTKFFPYPFRLRRASLLPALRSSLARLGAPAADLYLLHWPLPPVRLETWAHALADAVHAGLARAVGVSNCDLPQMDRVQNILARRGVPLAANQVQYNLLSRKHEHSGLLAACRDRGVAVMAYSPLAWGLLTGKYTPAHPPTGNVRAGRFGRRTLVRIQPLLAVLAAVAAAHGKTPAQVAVNWCMVKGTLPIPGAKNARQAAQNAGALGWSLTPADLACLDHASALVHP